MMKIRSKVVTGTIAVALAAIMSNGRPAMAASTPSVLAAAPPTYLISARGLSLDGKFDNTGATCSFCTNPGFCGCFFTDAANGGSGFFKFGNSAQTPLTWTIEIDYNNDPSNEIATTDDNSVCVPASGFGESIQLAGRNVNAFEFETTGIICNTATGNGTFTGSYILDGGSGNYSNATGSGSLTIGGYYSESQVDFVNQVQFTGNLGQ